MTEMVEKVARAIADHVGPGFDAMLKDGSELRREALMARADINDLTQCDMLDAARAALEAMRDFTPVVRCEDGVVHQLVGAPEDIWRTMIDAAINAKTPAAG